jgi:hypothetical protein
VAASEREAARKLRKVKVETGPEPSQSGPYSPPCATSIRISSHSLKGIVSRKFDMLLLVPQD